MSKEVNVPCQTFIKAMQCNCGGELRYKPSDIATLQYPPKYKHICNKCGKIEYFKQTYPQQLASYKMPEISIKEEFPDCQDCSAWFGSDCTRNPYTEGCLKE